jgi:NADPH:quinone reductase
MTGRVHDVAPDMTQAVVATAFGGPEVLELREVEVGAPGPGEVLVDVRAAAVNPIDQKLYSGRMGADPSALPMRLGLEVAGVVREVGPDAVGPVGPIAAGDEVIAYRVSGGYAESILAPASSIVPKPASLGWEPASGLMLTGATATHSLVATSVGAGDTVLIHGAAGGVGLMGVQLARLRGAKVIGTAGEASHDYLRHLGAIPVVYGQGLADRVRAVAPDGVDAAIDNVGTDEAIEVSLELVADRSRIATIANAARAHEVGIKALGGGPGADPGTDIRDKARLQLVELVAAGQLEVVVDRTWPLAEAADAHRYLAGGHAHGKVVLLPG